MAGRICGSWVRVRPTSSYGKSGWLWRKACTDDYGRQEAAVRRAASGFVVDLHSRRGVLKGVAKARTVEAAKQAAERALGL